MKYLRYALMAVAVVVFAIAGVAAYIAATFDPNAYKPQIIRLVQEKTQRTLKLDGDIKLALSPAIQGNQPEFSLGGLQDAAHVRTGQADIYAGRHRVGSQRPGRRAQQSCRQGHR